MCSPLEPELTRVTSSTPFRYLWTDVHAKELILYTRQDVYVERQRPTWSYRTSILQVGKMDNAASEYRAFLGFDLSSVAL